MAKRIKERLRGSELSGPRPDWRPLLDFAPDEVPDFMWMFRDILEDGTVVEAYKHVSTRRYLHLDASGRSYVPVGESSYEEADPVDLRAGVSGDPEGGANIVRQNDWVDGQKITWARSATRHRVSRARTLSAIRCAAVCFESGFGRQGEPRLFFFGDDENEQALEVVAFAGDDRGLFVVHSMPLRPRFKPMYEEAMRWRGTT